MRTLGVLVPCHNEALVIERKLRNLAACEWPASARPHAIVVVDDGSRDETARIALAARELFDETRVRLCVAANALRPGKGAAIEVGVRALGDDVDLIVLSDADVVIDPRALLELARAFEREPRLGMATGAQTFVESLADDGTLRAANGGALERANTLYDVATARVRALESRFGLVFSVHGQLLAWRRELALIPTPSIAADDLDLMLQVRTRGLRIERVGAARFYEVRAPAGRERNEQSIRRARAYVQFRRHPRVAELTRGGSRLARAHAWAYVHAEGMRLVAAVALAHLFPVAFAFGGLPAAIAALPVVALGFAVTSRSPLGWLDVAKLREKRGSMGDRWETARR